MKSFDVAVVGGGPAGATLATVCALNGFDVALYEKEHGPRYRVGESLLPSTPCQLAPLLGVADDIERAGFVKKPGATFFWGDRLDEPWTLLFGHSNIGLNVDRQRFDSILLDNASARGVEVYKGHSVRSIGDGDAVRGRVLEIDDRAKGRHRVRTRYVADASGQMRLKTHELDGRTWSRFFRNVAVWGYWNGAGRLDAPNHGNVTFEAFETEHGWGWTWFIPLSDSLTSVGALLPRAGMRALREETPRGAMTACLARCARISALLAGARPSSEPPYDEVRRYADFSYASEAFWAPGLVKVGDAACFVDVLLSSGVHLATYGALLAARSIEAVLRGLLPETLAMDEYESRLRQEFAVFYAGLCGLYDMARPREYYIDPLRSLMQSSNGVSMEAELQAGETGGLNCGPSAPWPSPEIHAARNLREMRAYNRRQLDYEGRPRNVTLAELPTIRNVLAISPDRLGWRLPGAV